MQKNVSDAGPEILAGLCELKLMKVAMIAFGLVTAKQLVWHVESNGFNDWLLAMVALK
jgi:hypothetical protein